MSLNNHQIIYTAEDIQKYFSGKLTPAEMHAMEKAALEDNFLAEAMEGYNELKETDWKPQLKLLKSKFEERETAKVIAIKVLPSYALWKVAAAVIVFCSGVAITYFLTTMKPVTENSIAATNTKQDSVNRTDTVHRNSDNMVKKATPLVESNKNAEQILDTKAHQKQDTDSVYLYRPDIVNKKKATKPSGGGFVEGQLKGRPDLASNDEPELAQQNKPEQYETKSNKVNNPLSKEPEYYKLAETTTGKTFKAQVTGPGGSQIPFANIRITNNQSRTYADARGNFTLKSADSILNIEIKSIGYVPGNFTLTSEIPLTKFELKPNEDVSKDKSLDEVVVTGYGTVRKSPLMPDSSINVVPLDGWNNYEIYIANNLTLPDNVLQKKIHGEVIVAFVVQSDGTLKNVKIEKSLCDDCDEAALRVIKEGPPWKTIKSNQPSGKVKVKF